MAAILSGAATVVGWAIAWAVVNPTIGAALVAGVASIVNTLLLVRHERHVDERFDERRNVIVKGTPEDPGAVLVSSEERRELEDRRASPAERRAPDKRRHRDKRK
jgi:hypothetical protein